MISVTQTPTTKTTYIIDSVAQVGKDTPFVVFESCKQGTIYKPVHCGGGCYLHRETGYQVVKTTKGFIVKRVDGIIGGQFDCDDLLTHEQAVKDSGLSLGGTPPLDIDGCLDGDEMAHDIIAMEHTGSSVGYMESFF